MSNFNIDNTYHFPDSWGSSQRTNNNVIIVHETTNIGAKNNATFFYNNWSVSETYVQYVIGDGGKIYQLSDEGYIAWGAGSWGNANAPVQIELARTTDKATFQKDYEALVNFVRSRADAYGIPKILDDSSDRGIKTHKWIATNKHSGDHYDPVDSYLKPFWGITQEQFAKDIANGIDEVVDVPKTFTNVNNVVTVLSDSVKGYTTYKIDGTANTTTNIAPGTGWISGLIEVIDGEPYYLIGNNIYIPQSITTFKNKVLINSDIPVRAVDLNGKVVSTDLSGGSAWKFSKLVHLPAIGWTYQIATNMFLPIKYAQGSGFKG